MQTMPSFAYLAPLALFFGIGPACAVVLTLIYALPPLVRITEHGIRSVSETTIEAAGSMGLTRRQLLRKVQLPDGPAHDRGRASTSARWRPCRWRPSPPSSTVPAWASTSCAALQTLNVGAAAVAGLAIVADRDHARPHHDRRQRAPAPRRARVAVGSGPGVMLTGVVLERLPRWATEETGRGERLPSR